MPSVRHRTMVVALALFSAISAISGGIALLSFPHGSALAPLTLLAHSPFASFVIPGLLLAVVVGGTSLAAAVLSWRRAASAVDATMLAGGAMLLWIVCEMAMLRELHWLQAIYGGLGLALAALSVDAALRSRRARLRWIVAVTFAETVGFAAPGIAGILGHAAGLDEHVLALAVVGAGFFEGVACGAGQAWAMPLPIRRGRFALATGVAAASVWALVLGATALLREGDLGVPWIVAVAIGSSVLGLSAIGVAQWFELRRVAVASHRWIAWTALAWALALPLSFLPGPAVDEHTPPAIHLTLWICAGVAMAYVLAWVTWRGVLDSTPPVAASDECRTHISDSATPRAARRGRSSRRGARGRDPVPWRRRAASLERRCLRHTR